MQTGSDGTGLKPPQRHRRSDRYLQPAQTSAASGAMPSPGASSMPQQPPAQAPVKAAAPQAPKKPVMQSAWPQTPLQQRQNQPAPPYQAPGSGYAPVPTGGMGYQNMQPRGPQQPPAPPQLTPAPPPRPASQWPQQPAFGMQNQRWPQNGYAQQPYSPKPPVQEPEKPPRKPILIWIMLAVVLVGLAVGGVQVLQQVQTQRQLEASVAAYDQLFCQGVYVDGIHLGGMTQQEGVNAVTAQAQQRNNNWYVRLMYNGQVVSELNAGHLGMTVNVSDALNSAWAQGHTGDVNQRRAAMDALLQEPFYAYSASPGGDTSVVDSLLEQLRLSVYRAPQDAVITEFNAAWTDPFLIQEAVPGRMLDTDGLRDEIYRMVSSMESGELQIVPTVLAPAVTAEDLRKTVSVRADFYTRISTTSEENRNNNIIRAMELLSGAVIAPGATFSFNDRVGERSVANGFYTAMEYAYGEETEGVGGGVCQASTTLYIAAVQAGLQIVKREPHSMKVNYTDYGKDATVNMDGKKIDLTFKNNTESNIYIDASVDQDPQNKRRWVARVTIYGMDLGNVNYDIVAETVEILPIPELPEYRKDKKGTYGLVYTTDEKQTSSGSEGCIVQSYRVKYVDGVEVERVPLYTDTYKARPIVIYTGTQKPPQ